VLLPSEPISDLSNALLHGSAKQATIFGINLKTADRGWCIMPSGSTEPNSTLSRCGIIVDQTVALAPDLLILSLGTNEALDYPYFDPHLQTKWTA